MRGALASTANGTLYVRHLQYYSFKPIEWKTMKRFLLFTLILLICADISFSQKRTTVVGDACTGEVTATNDSTREITITYSDKGKVGSFVGVLNEGYKVKMKDGTLHELKVSEIPAGTRIRVFYKTKEQNVTGQKVRLNRIFRVDFLTKDEYVQLREALNLPASTPVTLAESNPLPVSGPLKLYLVIDNPGIRDNFIAWVEQWNKDEGKKYGTIEIVPDFAQADVALVRYPSSVSVIHLASEASYVVVQKPTGLEVLWKRNSLNNGLEIFGGQPPPDEKQKIKAASHILESAMENIMKHRSHK